MKIEVWHDSTSEPQHPCWCVSLCEPDGDEIRCLACRESYDDAVREAQEQAAARRMSAYERDEEGELHLL